MTKDQIQRVADRYMRRAMEFNTPQGLDHYLRTHPGADKSRHTVKNEKGYTQHTYKNPEKHDNPFGQHDRPKAAMEFSSDAAMAKYLKEHPKADKSNHSVKSHPGSEGGSFEKHFKNLKVNDSRMDDMLNAMDEDGVNPDSLSKSDLKEYATKAKMSEDDIEKVMDAHEEYKNPTPPKKKHPPLTDADRAKAYETFKKYDRPSSSRNLHDVSRDHD